MKKIKFYFANSVIKQITDDSDEYSFCINEKVQIDEQVYIIIDYIINLNDNSIRYYLALV